MHSARVKHRFSLLLHLPLGVLWCILLCTQQVQGVTIDSLDKLQAAFGQSNEEVTLRAGTYTITADDIESGRYGEVVTMGANNVYSMLHLSGSNNKFDFSGVTLRISTKTFVARGRIDLNEIRITGNNNVLTNLRMIDDGDADDAPTTRMTNIVMDGRNNRIEKFNMFITGSFPYGYGDIFGKGGGPVIGHHKHSAILVRGKDNQVIDCTLIHRSYGHGIFMQAAEDPVVNGNYVEGEMRTVEDVLKERGSGSPADNVDFRTVWGFNLADQQNFRFSLQEDGIRAYNGGTTIIDGEVTQRAAIRGTYRDNTVVNMRSAFPQGHASGSVFLENNRALGCENGFWIGSNSEMRNCFADTSVGTAYSEGNAASNSVIELTILDDYETRIGTKPIMYIAGRGHKFTIHDETSGPDRDKYIQISGKRIDLRALEGGGGFEPDDFVASNIEFSTETPFLINLGAKATSNDIETCGDVDDDGSGNSVSKHGSCSSGNNGGGSFPDTRKKYYVESPRFNVRVAADGTSISAFTKSISTTGDDVEWEFQSAGNGHFFLQLANGGTRNRLRSGAGGLAEMRNNGSTTGTSAYFEITSVGSTGLYHLTLPDATTSKDRLRIRDDLAVEFAESSLHSGSWTRFRLVEV